MHLRRLCSFVAALTAAPGWAAPEGAQPSIAAARQALTREFSYDPTVRARLSTVPPLLAADDRVVTMEQVTVTESKNWNDVSPVIRRQMDEEKNAGLKLLEGGRLSRGTIGGLPYQTGIWKWNDLFSDDARFKSPKTRVDFDLLKIRW